MARPIERFEFTPEAPEVVLSAMARLTAAADGWVNLVPGLVEEEARQQRNPGFSGLFGSPVPMSTMCTWFPAGGAARALGRRPASATLGILHPRGRHAVQQLAELGVAVPDDWRVRQDHQRRGLLLEIPATATPDDVLDWALEAGGVLCAVPRTGRWQAVVYGPQA
jgi:hypothetical protein